MHDLRIGLAGCGRIARLVHLSTLARVRGARVVAVADADPAGLAQARALAPGARAYPGYAELLEDRDVEAVVIALPTSLHAEAAAAALGRGKHVYLEKPLASEIAGARSALAAARGSGGTAMIGFNGRFHPLAQEARRVVASGALGEVVAARLVFCSAARELPEWKRRRATGGGVLLDLASHQVDLLHFLLDDSAQEVAAQLHSRRTEDDTASLQIRMAGGALAQSFCSSAASDRNAFEIVGTRARLAVDRRRSLRVEITPASGAPPALMLWAANLAGNLASPLLRDRLVAPRRDPSYHAAFTHFVDAARQGRPASPGFVDGLRSLTVVLAAEESARAGRAVAIADSASEDPSR